MAFPFARQVLSALLVIATGSADTGLLILNRYLLLKGVFKFPYPIATTLVQCLITYFFVFAAEYPFRILLALLTPADVVGLPDVDKEALLYRDEPRRPSPTRLLRGFSPRRFGFRRSSNEQSLWQGLRRALPLAVVFLLKVALSNVFMTHLTIPAFTLIRIGAIPLAFAFNASLNGESHSIAASLSAILAVSSLFLAVLPLTDGIPIGNLILGVSLSVVDAMLPVLILRTCQEKCDAFPPDVDGEDPTESRQVAASNVHRLRQGSTFWPTLRHASLLSIIFLIPLVFLTGEARHIWNDSYVLDMACVKQLFFFSGVLNGTLLVIMSLLVMATSPVTTSFLSAFSNAIQIAIFCKYSLVVYNWLGLAGCWFFSGCFVLIQIFVQWRGEDRAYEVAPARNSYAIIRAATIILVLCLSISGIAKITWDQNKAPAPQAPSCQMRESLMTEIAPPMSYNFTSNARDDYLGARPDVDTIADLSLILDQCIEVNEGLGVDDVINCLQFLAHGSDDYLGLPAAGKGERASERSPSDTALDIDNKQKGMSAHYVKPSDAEPASRKSIGTCPGPVFPFHVYWTGPATWRLELFFKAYLYTQNLPCSRLYLWLESDIDSQAVNRMLCDDPIFRRFLPLVDRGDVVVKPWNFPKRIPIPQDLVDDPTVFHPHLRGKSLEMFIADNVVQDSTGKWLIVDPSLAHYTSVQVSDFVRFVVLHMHGGVYLDMDVMLRRDLRPLLLQPQSFAEQWVERCPTSDYNTAVISVPANSSLSTYLVRGGVRMGMNFHPKVIGRMMMHDDRIEELAMLQNAVFDPLVTDLRRKGTEHCTVPCHKNFEQVFRAEVEEPELEWSAYHGENTERTMDKFFKGSFAYHIHNQWHKFPEPTSWMDIITASQDGFFSGDRTNVYGEKWNGPRILDYDRNTWPGF